MRSEKGVAVVLKVRARLVVRDRHPHLQKMVESRQVRVRLRQVLHRQQQFVHQYLGQLLHRAKELRGVRALVLPRARQPPVQVL